MTRDGVLSQINDALAAAPKTSPRALLQALKDAGQFIEDQAAQPSAEHPQNAIQPQGESMAVSPGFVLLAQHCAAELEEAAALTTGVMDSDSKVAQVNAQRLGAMQAVAARLREIA